MVYRKVLFHWSLFFFILKQGQSCDSAEWMESKGNCYRIFTDRVNKSVAELTCLEHRSALASISNVEEHTFLVTQLSQTNTSEENFWIGLHKIGNELMWNNRAPTGNLPWVDVDTTSSLESSDCFIFNSAKVLPFQCSDEAGFVCEQWKTFVKKPHTCPEGTQRDLLSEKCFWFTHMPLSKAGAEVICSLKHGHLLVMRGEFFPLNIALILLVEPPPPPFILWTSLVVRNGSIQFEDGARFFSRDFDFVMRPGRGDCVALVAEKGKKYELHQKPCLEQAAGFCESDIDVMSLDFESNFEAIFQPTNITGARCPTENWKEHEETGFCYWENSFATSRLSWDDARKYCQSYGGDLASFHSPEEEKIGHSLLYGSVEHPYWIGLRYDANTGDYTWSDGSPLNHTNWDDGQPSHGDRRLQCVYMSSTKKKWELTYCGMLGWFICKAPKQVNPPVAVPLTPEPLTNCLGSDSEYFYDGYCYFQSSRVNSWHRAQQYCEMRQSSLVSLHSEDELNFLIRLMYSKRPTGNRVWIGLNSLALDGTFKWTDGTPVDFTNWDINEPNNFQNQEKCANMYTQHGMWNDENCNAQMDFICKRRNDTNANPTTTTPAPVTGYCQKDWHMFGDRCFLPVGLRTSQWKNWTEAGLHCISLGGYLASIRDEKDQAFMYYLIQNLKRDTWLGLHDSIHSGVYYWMDNSPVFYTNWAYGEPSSYGLEEDCVVIAYEKLQPGRWKDSSCERKLPFVCQANRDPSLPKPVEAKGTRCPNRPGYLKHGLSCYKLFTDLMTWEEAESACRKDGAYLVAISDLEKEAVVAYLTASSLSGNDSFWIGLRNSGKYPLMWENQFPLSFSKWGQNHPKTNPREDFTCYYSTVSGSWIGAECSEKKAFLCHLNAEKRPTPVTGERRSCSEKTGLWRAVGDSCMIMNSVFPNDWYSANFLCFSHGAHLASFHSMETVNSIKYYWADTYSQSVFIGLVRNAGGGFMWTDNSPVDFVNWDQGEPRDTEEFMCVEMIMDTLKWRVIDCENRRSFFCGRERELINSTSTGSAEKHTTNTDQPTSGLHPGVVIAIIIGVAILIALVVVGALRYRAWKNDTSRYRVYSVEPITSFENQIYDEQNSIDIHDRHVLYAKD